MNSADTFQLLRLFQKVAPAWFFHSLSRKHGYVFREGVYSAAVVIWLMIWQRLQGNRSLAAAVQHLLQGGAQDLVSDSKRWTEAKVSAATGSYCQARQKLPKLIVGEVMDRMVEQLRAEMQEGWAGLQRPVMLIDGSSLQLQHSPELVRRFSTRAQSTWGEPLAGDADCGIPRCVQRIGSATELGSDVWR